MESEAIGKIIGENFDLAVMGAIGFWIKSMLADIKKIDKLSTKIEGLKTEVEKFSGELKSVSNLVNSNNKEIALLQQSDSTQWKKVDELAQNFREMKL